jgi:enoyl-CoA hydratase/carnithine racemase
MAGARLDAAEALAAGLFDRVVDHADLMPTVRSLCTDALAADPAHAAAIKRMVPPR